MPRISYPEVLTEAAGVKIVTSPPEEDADFFPPGKIVLKMRKINATPDVHDKSCGFHLTKSKWDPYPWIGYVEKNSPANLAGLRTGDCLLGIDDIDLLGLKIKDIATLIRSEEGAHDINFSIWRYPRQKEEHDIGIALKGPLPDVARNLANALSGTVRSLECPICLESAAPPVSQCVHGHILCVICRPKTSRCPVCRVRLGQGRCLLADKLHIVLRDAFNVNNDETLNKTPVASEHCNLRDQLFGKNNKKQETSVLNRSKNNCTMLKPRQFLLARLLLGSREKAISADNLSRVSEISEGAAAISNEMTDANSLRLSLNDRTKSASTGELSRDSEARINESSSQIVELSATNTSRQSLSLPQTPIWGSSTDSMSCVQLTCPLLQSCRELVTADSLLEHIRTHALPQIHFYSGSARIPLPLPFGQNAFYIFHHGSNIFFFQCREETAWMTYPVKMAGYAISNTWEWTLHAWGDNGTEVQLRRYVASLEDPLTLSSQHVAPLPTALLLKTINIQISEHSAHDRLYV
ncbi:E3 ubiquitin-protein ligase DIS1 [Formica fusca]